LTATQTLLNGSFQATRPRSFGSPACECATPWQGPAPASTRCRGGGHRHCRSPSITCCPRTGRGRRPSPRCSKPLGTCHPSTVLTRTRPAPFPHVACADIVLMCHHCVTIGAQVPDCAGRQVARAVGRPGQARGKEQFNLNGVDGLQVDFSFGGRVPHVRPMARTCGEPEETKKNTHTRR
jgi:hypothetical protein